MKKFPRIVCKQKRLMKFLLQAGGAATRATVSMNAVGVIHGVLLANRYAVIGGTILISVIVSVIV